MAKDVVYVRHRPVEYHAFRSPTGLVGRWTTEQAEKVAAHARLLAPKPGQGRGYATGELAREIRSEPATIGRSGPEARVVSPTGHAKFVHEGTAPHIIKPTVKQTALFFRKAGRAIYTDLVKHPGTRANPYLVKALRAVFGGPGR